MFYMRLDNNLDQGYKLTQVILYNLIENINLTLEFNFWNETSLCFAIYNIILYNILIY